MPHFLSRPSSPLLDSLQQQQLHVSLAPRNPLLHVWPHQSRREGSPLPTCWQHSSSCSPGYHPAFLVARAHCWPSCILWIYRLSRGTFPCEVTENLARCSVIILFSSWSRCSLKSSHCRTSVPQDTLESTWCKSGCKLCKLGKALTEPSCFKTSFWASLQLVGSCSIAAGKYGLFNSISSLKCVSCPQKICLQTAKSPMEEQIYSFFQ